MTQAPIRSFLFVPAANDRLLESAAGKSSDAVILDLEDGTHLSLKPQARSALARSIQRLKDSGKVAAVRINGEWVAAFADLTAAVVPGLDIIVVPKVEHPRDVQVLADIVTTLEADAGIEGGHINFLLQIESNAALPRLYDIAAAHPRVMGMMLGSEDYSLDCGGEPTPETLLYPSFMVLSAARAAGIQPIGFIASIAELGEPEQFREVIERARRFGFRGAVVVHPKFVDVINDCYTPSISQLEQAAEIVDAFEEADRLGQGAIRHNGKMIDKPVYLRARELLAQHKPNASLAVSSET